MKIVLELAEDTPNSMTMDDTYEGIDDPWYAMEYDGTAGVKLWANRDGFEHLGRLFLKFARTTKVEGYHLHLPLDYGHAHSGPDEWTIGVCEPPEDKR